jgi:hypothetical protein
MSDGTPWAKPWPDVEARLAPLPALPLTEELRERLRRLRVEQMARHRAGRPQLVCGIFYDEEVVWLHHGGGSATFLGLDGRVHSEYYGEGKPVVVVTDPRFVAASVVQWASEIGLPELIALLPGRPPTGVACRLCEGRRWESAEEPRLRCRRCWGLGWTLA